jgi:hypothetical protein
VQQQGLQSEEADRVLLDGVDILTRSRTEYVDRVTRSHIHLPRKCTIRSTVPVLEFIVSIMFLPAGDISLSLDDSRNCVIFSQPVRGLGLVELIDMIRWDNILIHPDPLPAPFHPPDGYRP